MNKKQCKSCLKEREFLENGICYLCKNADSGTKIVENTKFNQSGTTEVKSNTGRIDDNIWMCRK